MTGSDVDAGLLQRIAARMPYMPPALRQVAELILKDPAAARLMSITSMATAADVAESTVSRFVRDLGLGGYQALRLGIAEAAFASRSAAEGPTERFVYSGVAEGDPVEEVARKIASSSLQALEQSALALNPEAVSAAVALIERSNVIVFACMGASGVAAEEGVIRFTRAGKKCLLFRDQSIQIMLATIVGAHDVVIALSDSGQSVPIIDVLRVAKGRGAATIAITSGVGSPLVDYADAVLYTAGTPSGGALYGEALTAKWGQILAVDTLYACFAALHFDETLNHLEQTYAAGIKHSRL